MGRQRSAQLIATAKKYIPGGVNSPARSWGAVGGDPIFIAKGAGSRVWDADGNEYIDYVCSWGPMILGHAHPEVIAAVQAAAARGTSFGAPTEAENDLAKMVSDSFDSVDLVRFVSSGTEAAMSALRLARAFTGRDKIVKFQGGYHGHADALLVAAGSGAMAHGVPDSAGVTASFAQDTLIAQFNDLDSVEAHYVAYPDQIACVIAEPVAGNMGVVPPQPGFLEGLRELTSRYRSLLIFDEVITGYRVRYGGAQHLYQVAPDVTCLGKIIGGGMPVGAYGGTREIMEKVSPLGPMYQAGTLSGNPLATAAGLAVLDLLEAEGVYEQLEGQAGRLALGLEEIAREVGVALCASAVGGLFGFFFHEGPVRSLAEATKADHRRFRSFFHSMLDQGIYLAPSSYEAGFLTLAHTDADIDATVDAAAKALA